MAFTRELYGPIIRLVVSLLILVIINVILINIPMIRDAYIPGFPFTPKALVEVIIGIIMIVMLLTFRRDFAPRLKAAYPNYPQGSIIVSSSVILAILIVCYFQFDGLIKPLMGSYAWAYPLIILLIAIWPLVALVTSLYKSGQPIAEKISESIATDTGELVVCPKCSRKNLGTAKFCTSCGSSLTAPALTPIVCASCHAKNTGADKYCHNCGKELHAEIQEFEIS